MPKSVPRYVPGCEPLPNPPHRTLRQRFNAWTSLPDDPTYHPEYWQRLQDEETMRHQQAVAAEAARQMEQRRFEHDVRQHIAISENGRPYVVREHTALNPPSHACPYCGSHIADATLKCPRCGAPQ